MPAVSANVSLAISSTFNQSFGNFGTPPIQTAAAVSSALTVGSGAAQFNNCYVATVSVTAGTPLLLDLNGGTLKNPDGTVIAMPDIVCLYVKNNGGAGQTITLGGGTNDIASLWGSTGTENVAPGASILKLDPAATAYVVTPSTAHVLQIVCASGTASVDICVIGH